jgi:hypothetical protein
MRKDAPAAIGCLILDNPMRAVVLLGLLTVWPVLATPAQTSAPPDGIDLLVAQIEHAVETGDGAALRALARFDTDTARLNDFVSSLTSPAPSSATVKERDRAMLMSGRQRLMLEILTDRSREGRVSTWTVDVAPPEPPAPTGPNAPWQIAGIQRLAVVSGLYRLALDTSVEYDVHNLTVQARDLKLSLPAGRAFVARSGDGPTAVVLLGRGRVEFSPQPEAERVQVKIFCGEETFGADFDAVFVRLNPTEFSARMPAESLVKRPVDAGDLRRGSQLFETYVPLSFQIDLSDLSAERWSLIPSFNDFVAEIVTRRFGSLTYARSNSEPEDISFFDRRRHRNISVYSSQAEADSRQRFFSEDDRLDYDITAYDIHAIFAPERLWVDGRARLAVRTRAPQLSTMTLRLADPLVVRSVTSPDFGRLLHLRIVGQNSILISFPAAIPADTTLELSIVYGGRLPSQTLDREAIALQEGQGASQQREELVMPLEPNYVYSNRSYWYPQSTVTDYATATLTITVPSDFDVVASGTPKGQPVPVDPTGPGQPKRKQYVFETIKPARYLACIISRFHGLQAAQLNLPSLDERGTQSAVRQARIADGGGAEPANVPFNLFVQANPHQFNRAKGFAERATDILSFYTSLIGEAPYGSFTVAITESDLPGGHSPAYFAIVNQPLPTTPFVWRNDPVAFENYPTFFLAHEVAHQWWGQAVGWKNYHEQWLSEGFAQYFAALYAERERGPDQFASVIRQMRRWAVDTSPQGPVYLGYRLGHIKSDSRVFRALVYNKGAMVLHMLRRLIGDRAFFSGLREFYATFRFKKAGTDDFRLTMEAASGRPLERFFDDWIFGSAIPTVKFAVLESSTSEVRVRFDQSGEPFDIPITVTLLYADGSSEDVIVALSEKTTERSIPLKRVLRSVDINRDGAALAEIQK